MNQERKNQLDALNKETEQAIAEKEASFQTNKQRVIDYILADLLWAQWTTVFLWRNMDCKERIQEAYEGIETVKKGYRMLMKEYGP